jgi:hypothetical protein
VRRLALAAGAGLAVFAIVTQTKPGWTALAFELLVLYLGGLLVVALVARTGGRLPSAGRSAIEEALSVHAPPPERVATLVRIERQVALGIAHAGDLHARLRPVFVPIAGSLAAARGVDLDGDPDRARALLGDEAWELVRPDAKPPREPFAPGIPQARLTAAVEALERMAQ